MSRPIGVHMAALDPAIHADDRVILNLLKLQPSSTPQFNYFGSLQNDIQPYMRKIVTGWMLEVCDEQKCEQQVFPLAINYMDRFLCTSPISRSQLQVLGAACLLLASKIRQCYSFSVDLLRAYTDNSVTPEQIRTWELLILSRLQWDLNGITAFDFVDQIIQRLPWCQGNDTIRHHAHTLVSVCYTEVFSITCSPSILASACVCAAAIGLKLTNNVAILTDVCKLSESNEPEIENLIQTIEIIIAKETETFVKQQMEQDISYTIVPLYEVALLPQQITNIDTRGVY